MTTLRVSPRFHEIARQLPFEAAGLRLRALEAGDAERHSASTLDPETAQWAYIQEDNLGPEAMRERIHGQYLDDAQRGIAVRMAIADPDSDEYLGHVAFFAERGDGIELGFVVAPDRRGQRVAQRALAASAEYARQLGYVTLHARSDVDNLPAHRTLMSAGYAPAGEPVPPTSEGFEHVRLQPFVLPLQAPVGLTSASLQARLEQLLRETRVPGAQVAVLHRGVSFTAASGVLSARTGLEVTNESIFQIGSITKLFTTVLVLQLVDEGLVALEDPVTDHVPEFTLKDERAVSEVRIIDLLQHRGGFDGDVFTDGGRGADAPLAILADLANSEMFFSPGEQFAYSNAGMVVLGRLIELKRGTEYLRVVRERIYAPLGLEQAVTLPEEAILHPVAVGHTRDEHGEAVVMPSWQLPMSAAATGAALTMSAENLARFGEMLLNGGRTRDGEQLLSTEMARLMGTRAFALPAVSSVGEGFGVGAFTYRYDGATAFGHDGQTVGQVAGLRVLPEADAVIAITTNRENTTDLSEGMIDFVLQQLCGARVIAEAPLPEPPLQIDAEVVAGFYANQSITATVEVENGEASITLGSPSIELGNQPAMRLRRLEGTTYRVTAEENGLDIKFVFTDTDGDGVADFLWFSRLLRRETRGAK